MSAVTRALAACDDVFGTCYDVSTIASPGRWPRATATDRLTRRAA
ncbi:hypothetical protein [Protofrankia sp. BMG5.30]|nr:hypothetical protein [Protofrankia sp. BMG5.30]